MIAVKLAVFFPGLNRNSGIDHVHVSNLDIASIDVVTSTRLNRRASLEVI